MNRVKVFTTILLNLAIVFSSCSKNGDVNTSDPANLSVEIISIDYETTETVIQATAKNATEFKLYIDGSSEAVIENETGFFKHLFGDIGVFTLEVRAYGTSGRYLKKNLQISLINDTISLEDGYYTPLEYEGYNLVWSDEFNETTINTNNWSFETGAGGWGNNEWQYYRPENAWLADGTLVIEARNESYSGSNYTSTRMITKDKKSFKYARVDIRALLPEGQGIWPALWMLGKNISSVGWPKCGEIDIMEMIGGSNRENTTHGTLHWDYNGEHASSGGSKTLASETLADKYHVFTIIWNENSITWYLDDIQFQELDITPDHMSEFHEQFFFIFNIAVGGNWPGYPDSSTIFPQQMKVDYIRVFQEN